MKRKMSKEERRAIERLITKILGDAASNDYAGYILEQYDSCTENTMMEDIIDHVLTTSAWEDEGYYNEDDVRLAIGRELMARLGVDY